MSSTMEVGKQLVDLCKQGKFKEAMESLYAPNIVSIEAARLRDNRRALMGSLPSAAKRNGGKKITKSTE